MIYLMFVYDVHFVFMVRLSFSRCTIDTASGFCDDVPMAKSFSRQWIQVIFMAAGTLLFLVSKIKGA